MAQNANVIITDGVTPITFVPVQRDDSTLTYSYRENNLSKPIAERETLVLRLTKTAGGRYRPSFRRTIPFVVTSSEGDYLEYASVAANFSLTENTPAAVRDSLISYFDSLSDPAGQPIWKDVVEQAATPA